MLIIREGKEKFNFRIVAIILHEEKNMILVHRKKGYNFWVLPGGRAEMGEDTSLGIKRELKEELNIKADVELKYVVESFFEFEDTSYHELGFYYKTTVDFNNYDFNFEEEFNGVEGEDYIFKWININEIDNYDLRPSFFKNKIKNSSSEVEHVIIDER